jgi:Lipase (class 3)
MDKLSNKKTTRLLKTMPAVAMLLSISIASAIDRPGPSLMQAQVKHAEKWSVVPTMGSANAQAMQTGSEGPRSEPWKGGMFPVLFLTASKGAVGTDIAMNTGFRYNIEDLPETTSRTLVYADVDSLKPSDRMIEHGLELARLNGWPIVLESKSKRPGALLSIIRAAFPTAKKIKFPANTTAISIDWKDGIPVIRPTDSRMVESTLLPEPIPRMSSRKWGTPKDPPSYLAYFAAAAFIDNDHVDKSKGVWDHAYYSDPQKYIDKIFGPDKYNLARNDSSRHWDLWVSTEKDTDAAGFKHPLDCVVAWRGTQLNHSNESDLITDLWSLIAFEEKIPDETQWTYMKSIEPKAGRGFVNLLKAQRSKIHHQLFDNNCAFTSVTGHSMGATMAQLFSTELWTAWMTTGDGGYLHDRFIKNTPDDQVFIVYPDPYKAGNDITIRRNSRSQWPFLGRLRAFNPIAPGGKYLRRYARDVMWTKPPNQTPHSYADVHIYCRHNDLAFTYGRKDWLNFGRLDAYEYGPEYGCDTYGTATPTGDSYAAKRANHSLRLWFGL